MLQLDENYAEEHLYPVDDDFAESIEMAETEAQPYNNSDGIIADAKLLGGEAFVSSKTVGNAINKGYNAKKAAAMTTSKALLKYLR